MQCTFTLTVVINTVSTRAGDELCLVATHNTLAQTVSESASQIASPPLREGFDSSLKITPAARIIASRQSLPRGI